MRFLFLILNLQFFLHWAGYSQIGALTQKQVHRLERIKSPNKKLKKYRFFFSKDSLKEMKRYERLLKKSFNSDHKSTDAKLKIESELFSLNTKLNMAGFIKVKQDSSSFGQITKPQWNRNFEIDTSSHLLSLLSANKPKQPVALFRMKAFPLLNVKSYANLSSLPSLSEFNKWGGKADIDAKNVLQYKNQYGANLSYDSLKKAAIRNEMESLERQAENSLMGDSRMGAMGNYHKQIESMRAEQLQYKKQMEQWKDSTYRKQQVREKASQEALDYLQKNSHLLKNAQDRMQVLMKKYSVVPNSNDLSTAIKQTSLKGRTFKERLVLGGNFNVVSMTPFSVDASPMIGYRWNTKFYTGIGLNYRLTFNDSLKYKSYISPSNTSIRVFGNYDLIKNFFAYAETEFAGLKAKSAENSKNEWRVNYFVGLGKKFLIHPKIFMTITCLYNVNGDLSNSSYPSRFQYRIGFTTSDLAFRKKKIYYNP